MIFFSIILSLFANHLPVMYVQVPQWADDWAVCAVDIGMSWHLIIPLVKDSIGKKHHGLMRQV